MNMNVYEIETPLNTTCHAYIVAPDMGEAERVFHEKYRLVKITAIKLVSSGPVLISSSAKESGPVRRWGEWTLGERGAFFHLMNKKAYADDLADKAIEIATREVPHE